MRRGSGHSYCRDGRSAKGSCSAGSPIPAAGRDRTGPALASSSAATLVPLPFGRAQPSWEDAPCLPVRVCGGGRTSLPREAGGEEEHWAGRTCLLSSRRPPWEPSVRTCRLAKQCGKVGGRAGGQLQVPAQAAGRKEEEEEEGRTGPGEEEWGAAVAHQWRFCSLFTGEAGLRWKDEKHCGRPGFCCKGAWGHLNARGPGAPRQDSSPPRPSAGRRGDPHPQPFILSSPSPVPPTSLHPSGLGEHPGCCLQRSLSAQSCPICHRPLPATKAGPIAAPGLAQRLGCPNCFWGRGFVGGPVCWVWKRTVFLTLNTEEEKSDLLDLSGASAKAQIKTRRPSAGRGGRTSLRLWERCWERKFTPASGLGPDRFSTALPLWKAPRGGALSTGQFRLLALGKGKRTRRFYRARQPL